MPKETFFNLPDNKREKLLDILIEAFSDNDYRTVSVTQIVKRAKIAKGSFYQYFEDKADCYLYLIELAMEEKHNFMQQMPPHDEQMGMFELLRWMLEVGVQFEFSNPRFAQISYRAVFDDIPLPAETLAVIRQSGQTFFRQLVAQHAATGYLRPDLDPDLAAFICNTVFTNLGQYMMERFAVSPESLLEDGAQAFNNEEMKRLMGQAVDLLEKGMRG